MAGRATAAAAALVLACSSIALADSVNGDADAVVPGNQGFVSLGTVAAGATLQVDVEFELACRGDVHVDPGVVVTLVPTTTPATGGAMTASTATIGPVPVDWPVDGDPCVDDPVLRGETVSEVSITAPGVEGNHVFRVSYAKTPTGSATGTTIVQFLVTVAANTAPVLHLPPDMTVEGNTTGGWSAEFSATATDAEDDPDPAVACDAAPGDVLPLGLSTVSCAATDAGGVTTAGTFTVTVTDTTPPVIDAAADITAETDGLAGALVAFPTPAAADVVDPAPGVTCDPASASSFALGVSLVTCTATDASGNSAGTAFAVTVVQRGPMLSATWQRPLGESFPALVANAGRTVPLKLDVRADGTGVGPADISTPALLVERLDGCAADAPVIGSAGGGSFTWADGAWHRNLDTSGFGGCIRVTAVVDGDGLASAVIQIAANQVAAKRAR
jgi:hypothetical protein